jgi:hypothetical protein
MKELKKVLGYRCKLCKKEVKKISEWKKDECPENHQHEFEAIYKSLQINMPFWVLIDLLEEKTGRKEDCDSRGEILPEHEQWIIDNLSLGYHLIKEGNIDNT